MSDFSNLLFRIKAYSKCLFTASHKKGHGIHSPFLYKLITKIFPEEGDCSDCKKIESSKVQLLQNNETINRLDLGAGSSFSKKKLQTISSVAKHSVINKKYGRLLFRLVGYFGAKNILELGTSFGISSMYMAAPDSSIKLQSIEGCPETAKKAASIHKQLGFENIQIHKGNFDVLLPEIIEKAVKIDFVFFDGNHQKEPTLKYFELCKSKVHNDTVFVFDDINWSKGMQQAWTQIKADPDITLTINIYRFGIVFFKKELSKEDFVVRY